MAIHSRSSCWSRYDKSEATRLAVETPPSLSPLQRPAAQQRAILRGNSPSRVIRLRTMDLMKLTSRPHERTGVRRRRAEEDVDASVDDDPYTARGHLADPEGAVERSCRIAAGGGIRHQRTCSDREKGRGLGRWKRGSVTCVT